jgi:acetyltransferase-like isoleucine patch superfamily enzyme
MVVIGDKCNLRGTFHIRQTGSKIAIGPRTTFVTAYLFALEGRAITIGDDCMFSSGIIIRTSDEHSIIDLETNQRINPAADVIISEHVWLGEGVTVNKGSFIAKEVVVGAKSLVTGSLAEHNSIYGGVPAKVLRRGVGWDRRIL